MKLTETSIPKLKPMAQRFDVTDDAIANLCIRVYPGGRKSWVYRYRSEGKSKRFLIGDAETISPTKARRKAKTLAGDVANEEPNGHPDLRGGQPHAFSLAHQLDHAVGESGQFRPELDDRRALFFEYTVRITDYPQID